MASDSHTASEVAISKEKTGIVMVGDRRNASTGASEMCIIAPWLEGAFDDGTKAYLLPRGTMDDDELEKAEIHPHEDNGKQVGYLGEKGLDVIIRAMGLEPGVIRAMRKEEIERTHLSDDNPHKNDPITGEEDLLRVKRFLGALRESYEETGINVTRIEGFPTALTHPQGFINNGVRLKEPIQPGEDIDKQLLKSEEIVPSSRTNPHYQTLFMVNIEGIENLMDNVKGRREDVDMDAEKVPEELEARKRAVKVGLPQFDELLQVLRRGMVPKNIEDLMTYNADEHWNVYEKDGKTHRKRNKTHWQVNPDVERVQLFAPSFDKAERDWLVQHELHEIAEDNEAVSEALKHDLLGEIVDEVVLHGKLSEKAEKGLQELETLHEKMKGITEHVGRIINGGRYMRGERMTEEQFDTFYQAELEQDKKGKSQSYANILKEDVARVKAYLKPYYKDVVGDQAGLKLNTKNKPLRWTQEGADLIPVGEYARRVAAFDNQAYRDMMGERMVNDRTSNHSSEYKSTFQIIHELCSEALRMGESYHGQETGEGQPDTNVKTEGIDTLCALIAERNGSQARGC